MEKELNKLNKIIAPMRDLSINGARANEKNLNRTLFSRQSLIDHNVPGYGNVIEGQDR